MRKAHTALRAVHFLIACSLGGGLAVGVSLVEVVSLIDGWRSDCGRHIQRFAPLPLAHFAAAKWTDKLVINAL